MSVCRSCQSSLVFRGRGLHVCISIQDRAPENLLLCYLSLVLDLKWLSRCHAIKSCLQCSGSGSDQCD